MNITKEKEQRRITLEKVDKLKQKGLNLSEISEIVCVHERTIKRWRKAYREHGLRGLEPLSKRPKRLARPRVLTQSTIETIEFLRKQNPYYGKVKILELLLRQGFDISLTSVGNALKKLMNNNKITAVHLLTCQKERKIIRKFNGHSKRLPKGYKAQVQIDHMVLDVKGKEIRQFCAYSKDYKISIYQVYEQARSTDATDFLFEVVKQMPFTIKDIQVDGGSEFRLHFEQACKNLKIKLFVLPPSSPDLNAGVERLNRICQEEHYLRHYNEISNDIDKLRTFVKLKQNDYNFNRLHRSLVINNRIFSPMEFFNLKRDKCI
jgi:transposase